MVYGAGKDSVFDLRETEWDNQYKTEQTLDATLTSAEALSASIEQLVDAKRLEVDNSAANALSQVVRDQQVIALIGIAVLVISLLILIFYVRGNLIKRLLRVIDGMRRVANGDLSTEVRDTGRDEIGRMAEILGQFRETSLAAQRAEENVAREREIAETERRRAMLELADAFEASVMQVAKDVSREAENIQTTSNQVREQAEIASSNATGVAGASEEGFLAVIVIVGPVLEIPVPPAHVEPGELGFDCPAGESPRCLSHVGFGVVAHAQSEQFEKLPAPILINCVGVVLVVVQPEDHGRASRDFEKQVSELSETFFAEHIHHVDDLVIVVHFGNSSSENLMPEQGHFFLQRSLGVYHSPDPTRLAESARGAGFPLRVMVPEKLVDVYGLSVFRVQKFFDGRLVSDCDSRFQLLASGAETRAPHEMGHR